jgi:hypothetical protein
MPIKDIVNRRSLISLKERILLLNNPHIRSGDEDYCKAIFDTWNASNSAQTLVVTVGGQRNRMVNVSHGISGNLNPEYLILNQISLGTAAQPQTEEPQAYHERIGRASNKVSEQAREADRYAAQHVYVEEPVIESDAPTTPDKVINTHTVHRLRRIR